MTRCIVKKLAVTCAAASVVSMAAAVAPAHAATHVPCNTTALRNAITTANTAGQGSLSLAWGCRYELQTALPDLTGNLKISGNGARITRSTSAPAFRILTVEGTVTLNALTVSNGSAVEGGGVRIGPQGTLRATGLAVLNNTATSTPAATSYGGGIANLGNLHLSLSRVDGNKTVTGPGSPTFALGGGIGNMGGRATISTTSITNNQAFDLDPNRGPLTSGGGIINFGGGSLTMTGGVISGNDTTARGGGISINNGSVALHGVRVANNHAGVSGGGINNFGQLRVTLSTITNNTVSGPQAENGGGISQLAGQTTLTLSRVTGNTPDNCAPTGSIPSCTN
ncbi:hypothetical protein ACN6AT_39310 (plasmid) [Streptomyces sp. JL4002]|uniref:hypothetical protein n=1 Tax=Streptomyces sp. JL4002 TaxID=3404781 RepID=UPI003B284D15